MGEYQQQLAALRAEMDEMDDCREQSIKRGSAQIKAEREVVNLRAKLAEAEKIADMIYTHPENFTQVQQWAQDIIALRGDSDG